MSMRWYIVHAYSNFEKKVADAIREGAAQRNLSENFEEILVPTEQVVEVRRGRKVNTERKFFPGYVLVKCELTDPVFSLIKNTPKVTGFLGAGKTTLVNLLMRFYDVWEGSITLDGVDIRELSRDNLRSQFGMVLQDTWLFTGTIEENIAYGAHGPKSEDVVNAAKAANIDHFIRSLPNGFETELNDDNAAISNGERQLLTIARAFISDPAILILDEATSSVDTRTDSWQRTRPRCRRMPDWRPSATTGAAVSRAGSTVPCRASCRTEAPRPSKVPPVAQFTPSGENSRLSEIGRAHV